MIIIILISIVLLVWDYFYRRHRGKRVRVVNKVVVVEDERVKKKIRGKKRMKF